MRVKVLPKAGAGACCSWFDSADLSFQVVRSGGLRTIAKVKRLRLRFRFCFCPLVRKGMAWLRLASESGETEE